MKCVVYVRGGNGDIYPFLARLPKIMKKYKLEMKDIDIYLDSVYTLYPQQHKFNFDTMMRMFIVSGINKIYNIPLEVSSADDLIWPSQNAVIYGPKINRNFKDDDFMFWRRWQTKEYIKDRLVDCLFIDNVVDQTYIWQNGKYTQVVSEEEPLEFTPSLDETTRINILLQQPHILIHYRVKGKEESEEHFSKIIEFCNKLNIMPILIGLKSENLKGKFVDLREKLTVDGLFYITEQAKLMLTSSSVLTFHRLYSNFSEKKTIVCSPYSLGGYENNFNQYVYKNKKHIFFNSDNDNFDKICEMIKNEI